MTKTKLRKLIDNFEAATYDAASAEEMATTPAELNRAKQKQDIVKNKLLVALGLAKPWAIKKNECIVSRTTRNNRPG